MFFSFIYLQYATIAAEQLLVTVYMTLYWIYANSSYLIVYEPPSYFDIFREMNNSANSDTMLNTLNLSQSERNGIERHIMIYLQHKSRRATD